MEEILTPIAITRPQLLAATHLLAHEKGTILLYSGGDYETSHYSYLCLFPLESISIKGFTGVKKGLGKSLTQTGHPWETLQAWLSNTSISRRIPRWVGYLGYEMGAFSDGQKIISMPSSPYPDAFFYRFALLLIADLRTGTGTLLLNTDEIDFLSTRQQKWVQKIIQPSFWEQLSEHSPSPQGPLQCIKSFETQKAYAKKIETAKELIYSGEIYQVNLSQQLLFKGKIDAFSLFHALALSNPAPFSAYLHLPELEIASSSPERLLKKQGSALETRPIKGTTPRGKNAEEDLKMHSRLMQSEKERAELLMITDLMRNDLGRISTSGSVSVHNICTIEAYENVFHMLSTIQSQALPSIEPLNLLRACFPGGSVTGCPKLRAMEVISQIENRSRGVYTGSIGYFAENGDFDFNIAIRTAVKQNHLLDVQLGGGIVADSESESEHAEVMHKGASILRALAL